MTHYATVNVNQQLTYVNALSYSAEMPARTNYFPLSYINPHNPLGIAVEIEQK